MKTRLKAVVVSILGAVALTGSASAQTDQGPAAVPETVAPPGIIVMPPRLPPPVSVPGEKMPASTQQPHTCPANDQRLELIG